MARAAVAVVAVATALTLHACCVAAQTATQSAQPSFGTSTLLFPLGSTWKVLDANVDLTGSTATPRWTNAAFDDTAWLSGPASLGFGFTSVQGERTTLTVSELFV